MDEANKLLLNLNKHGFDEIMEGSKFSALEHPHLVFYEQFSATIYIIKDFIVGYSTIKFTI